MFLLVMCIEKLPYHVEEFFETKDQLLARLENYVKYYSEDLSENDIHISAYDFSISNQPYSAAIWQNKVFNLQIQQAFKHMFNSTT